MEIINEIASVGLTIFFAVLGLIIATLVGGNMEDNLND